MSRRFCMLAAGVALAATGVVAVAEASPSGPQLGTPLASQKEADAAGGVYGVTAKGKLTFTVKTAGGVGDVFVVVSRSSKSGPQGLANPEWVRKMNHSTGGRFTLDAESYPNLKPNAYWLNRPGTYYWRAFRVNCKELRSNDGYCAIPSTEVRKLPVREG